MKVWSGCDLLQYKDKGPKLEPASVTSYQAVLYVLPRQHSRPHLWHVTCPDVTLPPWKECPAPTFAHLLCGPKMRTPRDSQELFSLPFLCIRQVQGP